MRIFYHCAFQKLHSHKLKLVLSVARIRAVLRISPLNQCWEPDSSRPSKSRTNSTSSCRTVIVEVILVSTQGCSDLICRHVSASAVTAPHTLYHPELSVNRSSLTRRQRGFYEKAGWAHFSVSPPETCHRKLEMCLPA